jgi:23S rRNA (adenine2503-C2)-methyltransferase
LATFPEELEAWLTDQGVRVRPEHCRRAIAQVVALGRDTVRPTKSPIPRAALEAMEAGLTWRRLEVVERVTDPTDGFVKYLFRSPDGALTEAVRIPLKKPGRFTVCLSSQVGCAMQCVFCATGRLGLSRNLEAWEMVAAFLTVRDEAPGRVTGAVFQGQGEPFHNYDEVIRAARMLAHPCGGRISAKAITISTVGLVTAIRRYTREGHPFRLILSLTSAVPERRARLLPIAGKVPLEDLVDAIAEHAAASRFGLQTIAWVVMGGVNHDAAEVQAMQRLFKDLPVRVNLIPVNDPRPDGFRRATDDEMGELMDQLQVLKMPVVRRYSGGQQRQAGCGMLASARLDLA